MNPWLEQFPIDPSERFPITMVPLRDLKYRYGLRSRGPGEIFDIYTLDEIVDYMSRNVHPEWLYKDTHLSVRWLKTLALIKSISSIGLRDYFIVLQLPFSRMCHVQFGNQRLTAIRVMAAWHPEDTRWHELPCRVVSEQKDENLVRKMYPYENPKWWDPEGGRSP